jgi:hypothetical protein
MDGPFFCQLQIKQTFLFKTANISGETNNFITNYLVVVLLPVSLQLKKRRHAEELF